MGQIGFLDRIRSALVRGRSAAPPLKEDATTDEWIERAERIRAACVSRWEELLVRFTGELEAVAGVVHRLSVAGIPALVARLAREHRLSRVITWRELALGVPGLLAALQAEGLAVDDGSSAPEQDAGSDEVGGFPQRMGRGEIGLTAADYAVAESGSLVLVSGSGKGRLVSCLPVIHVAILRPGQLVETWDEFGVLLEASHRLGPPGDSPSNITFITGPSRTADIELSLTRGVHGPKEVHVLALQG
jgi:L-lactate dehydrogenase complex protein LldG